MTSRESTQGINISKCDLLKLKATQTRKSVWASAVSAESGAWTCGSAATKGESGVGWGQAEPMTLHHQLVVSLRLDGAARETAGGMSHGRGQPGETSITLTDGLGQPCANATRAPGNDVPMLLICNRKYIWREA